MNRNQLISITRNKIGGAKPKKVKSTSLPQEIRKIINNLFLYEDKKMLYDKKYLDIKKIYNQWYDMNATYDQKLESDSIFLFKQYQRFAKEFNLEMKEVQSEVKNIKLDVGEEKFIYSINMVIDKLTKLRDNTLKINQYVKEKEAEIKRREIEEQEKEGLELTELIGEHKTYLEEEDAKRKAQLEKEILLSEEEKKEIEQAVEHMEDLEEEEEEEEEFEEYELPEEKEIYGEEERKEELNEILEDLYGKEEEAAEENEEEVEAPEEKKTFYDEMFSDDEEEGAGFRRRGKKIGGKLTKKKLEQLLMHYLK